MDRYQKGITGEDTAAGYLEKKGYQILERRFRSKHGEVDIIARKGNVVVFVEVKAWDVLGMENLERAIDLRKREKIRQTALFYLSCHTELGDCHIRFDLVFLSWRMGRLEHWDNAF